MEGSCDLTGFAGEQGKIIFLPEDRQNFGILGSFAVDTTTCRSIHLQMDVECKRRGGVVKRNGR